MNYKIDKHSSSFTFFVDLKKTSPSIEFAVNFPIARLQRTPGGTNIRNANYLWGTCNTKGDNHIYTVYTYSIYGDNKEPTGHRLKPKHHTVLVCAHPHVYEWIRNTTSAVPPHGIKIESHCFLLSWNRNPSPSAFSSSASETDRDKGGPCCSNVSLQPNG